MKIFSTMFAATLMALFLVGCPSDTEDTPTDTTSAEDAAAPEDTSSEGEDATEAGEQSEADAGGEDADGADASEDAAE